MEREIGESTEEIQIRSSSKVDAAAAAWNRVYLSRLGITSQDKTVVDLVNLLSKDIHLLDELLNRPFGE